MEYAWVLGTKFLLVFSSLFVIVDPFAIIPTFLALTKNTPKQNLEKIIRTACMTGAEILIFFQLFGNAVFHLLGIKLDAFKVAGGVLLFLTALDMIKAKELDQTYSSEVSEAEDKRDISIVPLAIPLLAGPGSITSVIVFSNDPQGTFVENTAISITSIILVFVLSYIVLKYSLWIKTFLGKSGISVMQRIMGILLAAISLQMIVEGLVALFKSAMGT
ncbi:MarC family protein [Bdellovibrio sp. HCB209]|uniref:MarC family protein n=1 Tax=Bdellovibrio sp. HCB209 TaxID=3394354 RepID=UPI0039B51A5F